MSTVHNNRINIPNYLPTQAQFVRSMGYVTAITYNIAALGAAYIAIIQVAERSRCMTGFTLRKSTFGAEIISLDTPGTYALVPAAFAVAAIGLDRLASKIVAYTTAWAATLEDGIDQTTNSFSEDSSKVESVSESKLGSETIVDDKSDVSDPDKGNTAEAKDSELSVANLHLHESEA